jgi:hypothetical protein
MKRYGDFDLTEINSLYPYEMQIYLYQILQATEEEKKQNGK